MTQWGYDAASQLSSTTDPLGGVTSFSYDNLGRQILVTLPDPDGSGSLAAPQQSATYDAVGNVVTQTDPVGNLTQLGYDHLNRLELRTQPCLDGNSYAAATCSSTIFRGGHQALRHRRSSLQSGG